MSIIILFILLIISGPYLIITTIVAKYRKVLTTSYIDVDKLKSKLKFKAAIWFFVWVVATFLILPITITTFCSDKISTVIVTLSIALLLFSYLLYPFLIYGIISKEYKYKSGEWNIFTFILDVKLNEIQNQ